MAFQAKTKTTSQKEPPIPASLKAAASDVYVFLDLAVDDELDIKEFRAKTEKYRSELIQAEDAGASGNPRFKTYQQAGLDLKLGFQTLQVIRACAEQNRQIASMRKDGLPVSESLGCDEAKYKNDLAEALNSAKTHLEMVRH